MSKLKKLKFNKCYRVKMLTIEKTCHKESFKISLPITENKIILDNKLNVIFYIGEYIVYNNKSKLHK